jgi:hypothetical protein
LTARVKNLKFVNPYLDDLVLSLSKYYHIINKETPSAMGIFGLFKFLPKTNYVLFNWIEKLPENKAGMLQSFALFILFPLFKIFNVKIIWTMHNKLTHSKKHQRISNAIFRSMLKKSDYILTHSSEGIEFGESLVTGAKSRIHYFPHPIKDRRSNNTIQKKYDILIWGSLSPYKGIIPFLEYLHKNKVENKYKILIIGTASSEEFFKEISALQTDTIEIRNEFIEDSKLQQIIEESEIVLFSYNNASILSSGALIDSIGYGAQVIGPHVGAFADLAKDDIVQTFQNFDELIPKIDKYLKGENKQESKVKTENFIKENSWDKYAEYIRGVIEA